MTLARAGSRAGLAGLFLLGASNALQTAQANGDTRTLSFHHLHTDETITVTFKRDGRYDAAALKKLDWFMRDWRKNESTAMDPQLFDLLWEVYREVGGTQPIDIICGYRSPGTNSMLRARSRGVARNSQHVLGKAMDFHIPGVPLAKVRAAGLRLQRGGVGFYPSSGSPFVHMDTSTVRHWPRIARAELEKIFPDGRTVHVPSDGRPLRNYALALADIERRGNAPNGRSLEAAREAGVITASQEEEAEAIAQRPRRGLLARLFGNNRNTDEDDEAADTTPAAAPAPAPVSTPKHARGPMVLASALPPAKPVATSRITVPLPAARPVQPAARPVQVAAAEPAAADQPTVTASVERKPAAQDAWSNVPVARDVWGDPVVKRDVWGDPIKQPSAPAVARQAPFELASAAPTATGSAHNAMAFAPERAAAPAPERAVAPAQAVKSARPMGKAIPQLAREATVLPSPGNTTVAVKPPMTSGAQRSDSPWLRAAMLTPSVSGFMTATRLGTIDRTWLSALIEKPAQALVMTFSADPHLGMVSGSFSGHAVVFLATATFSKQTTASLR